MKAYIPSLKFVLGKALTGDTEVVTDIDRQMFDPSFNPSKRAVKVLVEGFDCIVDWKDGLMVIYALGFGPDDEMIILHWREGCNFKWIDLSYGAH